MKIVLYLHMHQPWRLGRFRYLDLGSGRPYFDVERNFAIFRGIAERCYLPALERLIRAAREDSGFRLSLSVTGTFLEQARTAAPAVIDRLRELYRTGQGGAPRRDLLPLAGVPGSSARTARRGGPASGDAPQRVRRRTKVLG
ncbi:Alpha-amylase/alpha [mine drainage metagenome]|uniref:Alpha-amylase/alpha n=1 Tax=mine drainage metagenome TaxID=410659 RepID=T0ZVD2_9ZZZZ